MNHEAKTDNNHTAYLSCCTAGSSAGKFDSGSATKTVYTQSLHQRSHHAFLPSKHVQDRVEILTCCRLDMFHPRGVIAHNIYMLQAGQHFDLPKDLQQAKQVKAGTSYLCI